MSLHGARHLRCRFEVRCIGTPGQSVVGSPPDSARRPRSPGTPSDSDIPLFSLASTTRSAQSLTRVQRSDPGGLEFCVAPLSPWSRWGWSRTNGPSSTCVSADAFTRNYPRVHDPSSPGHGPGPILKINAKATLCNGVRNGSVEARLRRGRGSTQELRVNDASPCQRNNNCTATDRY